MNIKHSLLLAVVTSSLIAGSSMRTFQQNKLWRDIIVDLIEKDGSKIHWRRLNDVEFDQQLRIKLLEEAHEVVESKNRQELIEEIADVYEVIDSLAQLHQISPDEIRAVQTKKREERGGFSGRKFATIAEHPAGGLGETYCLANPAKYPEITK